MTIASIEEEQKKREWKEKYKRASVGEIVEFGNYNGCTTWRVLYKSDTRLMLITEKVVEKKAYNDKREMCNWQSCSLRKWLNDEYYNKAFNEEEKEIMANTVVEGVSDKVAILTAKQADELFFNDEDRKGYYYLDNAVCIWRLCIPIKERSDVYGVEYYGGDINYGGGIGYYCGIDIESFGVRPVIMLDIAD